MQFLRSPNFSQRVLRPLFIVLHDCVAPSLQSLTNTMLNPSSMVSYHYAVDKDGTAVNYVNPSFVAWHAGESMYQQREVVLRQFNNISIGIALVGMNQPDEIYPNAQMAALQNLVKTLCRQYQIPPESILRHADISLWRGKTDPRNFDIHAFRDSVRPNYRLPAFHPDNNEYIGDVTVVESRKVYPVWLRGKSVTA